jgi:hypothetical protein
MSSLIGSSGAPSLTAVVVTMTSLLFVNALVFVVLTTLLYAVVLRAMGYAPPSLPAFLERLMPAGAGGGGAAL